jgi:hypothetical protein
MNIRVSMIAISAVSTAAIAAAQPAKDEQPSKAPKPASQVVLASASDVRRASPAEAERPSQVARRAAPRVTTCRCGDPQPEQDEGQQPDE